MGDMAGQVALVTGGVRGIGRAICERLYARGVTVAAGYSRGKEAADQLREEFPGSSVHQGNIGANIDCERVIREVLDTHGRLDILVNNAGITLDRTVRKMTPDDWDRVIQGRFVRPLGLLIRAQRAARMPGPRIAIPLAKPTTERPEELVALLTSGSVTPIIDRVFDFDDAADSATSRPSTPPPE